VASIAKRRIKNKIENVAYFLHRKKRMLENHVYHAMHHSHTTFSPRLAAGNREKPLQNTANSTEN
jgi:hypothetical protein